MLLSGPGARPPPPHTREESRRMSSASRMLLHKVVVLGDGGVGKTALTIQLCLNHFVETYDPTIEDSYRKQVQVDGHISLLEVLDTAGQEEYTALRDQWIRDGEGFLLVYSITSRNTFERIRKFVDQIIRVKDTDIFNIPVMLVGNKCDKTLEREVSIADGANLAKALRCDFLEASAKTCVNVEEAFHACVRKIRQINGEPGGPEQAGHTDSTGQLQPSHSKEASPAPLSTAKPKKDKKCSIM